ncbi:MAG TPA: hypothetical protein VMN36_09470 [Verrucomicrobiales bacterium]|nr:hypothetical protein [Verrucomicrobiales bacterium]
MIGPTKEKAAGWPPAGVRVMDRPSPVVSLRFTTGVSCNSIRTPAGVPVSGLAMPSTYTCLLYDLNQRSSKIT